MIVGHAGIALLARRISKAWVSLAWLLFAAYFADLLRLVLKICVDLETANWLSHSIPAIAIEALGLSMVWYLRHGGIRQASLLGLVALLHWPADLLTGCKETWPGGGVIGLAMYQHPEIDFVVELGLVALALFWVKSDHGAAQPREWLSGRRGFLILVALQLVATGIIVATSTFRFRGEDWQWTPALGLARFRPMRVDVPVCIRGRDGTSIGGTLGALSHRH